LFVKSISRRVEQVEHQREQHKGQSDPFGHLGKLAVPSRGLALGQEGIRAAGDGAGQAGALSGLEQHDNYEKQAGEKLDDGQCKSHFKRSFPFVFINPDEPVRHNSFRNDNTLIPGFQEQNFIFEEVFFRRKRLPLHKNMVKTRIKIDRLTLVI